jgi:Raf kinase inhibitor-like YbhB/YbcL family protein
MDASADGEIASDGGNRDAVPIEASRTDAAGPFALTSTAWREGETIPLMYKCAMVPPPGDGISPPLAWTPGPAATKSYAVTLIHNAPDMSIHWVIWDIPASTLSLQENVEKVAEPPVPAGTKQVRPNLDGSTWYGYLGPCPQAVNSRQNYLFAVHAVDVDTLPGITPQSSSAQAMSAVRAHQLARATLGGSQIRQ